MNQLPDEGREILDAMDVLVNRDAITVLRDTTFSSHVLITGPCVVQNCVFPYGLTIQPGASAQFLGENEVVIQGNRIMIGNGMSYIATLTGGQDVQLA